MQLKDLVKEKTYEEELSVHEKIRKNRTNYKKSTRKTRKKKRSTASVLGKKRFDRIKKDKEKLKELLDLLK